MQELPPRPSVMQARLYLKNLPGILLLFITINSTAQTRFAADSITRGEVSAMMQVLAGDSLRGRGNLQPGLLKAACFIGTQFRGMGLKPLPGNASFFIPFRPAGGRKNEAADLLTLNGKELSTASYMFFHEVPGDYADRDLSSFKLVEVSSFTENSILELPSDTTALLVWTRQPLAKKKKVQDIKFNMPADGLGRDLLLMVSDSMPRSLTLRGSDSFYASLEYNVVAVLPGSSAETLMLCAHYDHEGVIPGQLGDSIMNGANDNASGTTALLTLASRLSVDSARNRTIIFAAFAAEELGLVGSLFYTENNRLDDLIAVVNLEMLGIPQLGPRTVFITGQFDSNLPRLLRKELTTAGLKVVDDPVPDRNLYERSDNYPFALKDVPAHTIMGSTDDDECYHQFCDELERIDMGNLTAIINSVRKALSKFVNGELGKKEIR